ncbi:hypothetical protein MRB53_012954 [Persea americana]|uniref:Uncharacterized protein n=1 Tax=Persea americana TaxID=3435 RepID=A0ACC2M0G2_PERAE|nr:hypothetical protein MRB53_012954 [Persea americana]|eukprot:TRINITY_DN8744_c0_g2_i2.p1 TRINITY_DN8744_c0_g2~~TRINITY_DN8744_c0_g2_i2.p1  ORF type:complete len:487 (-),score=72.65 TRINITY_DN8744_c0_g2_i2:166-1626(-)
MDPIVQRLQKAALDGDVAALLSLIQEDPLLLQKIECTSAAGNPLHVASLRGDHVDFAKELLKQQPELAGMRNEEGSCPIHLAAARGHLGVVKQILGTNNPCFWRVGDKDGRNALHLAAANGRVDVVKELLRVAPELAQVKALSSRGETALHMCLRNNQVEAAEVLVHWNKELVNVKDLEGNSVLHLATARRQFQMLELFLTETQVKVNATNEYGFTALDILAQGPSQCDDMGIHHLLSSFGCKRNRKPNTQFQITNPFKPQSWKKRLMKKLTPSSWFQKQKKDKDWFKEKHNTLLIVATLIATVTFAAGLSPPGGVWQDSNSSPSPSPSPLSMQENRAGKAIQNKFEPRNFKLFMYFDMSGLVSSLFIILFLVSGLPLKNVLTTWILVITMWVAVTSVTMAFVYGTRLVVVSDRISRKLFWVLVSWTGFMGLLLFWHFIVFIFHLIHLCLSLTPVWLWVADKVRKRNERVSGEHQKEKELEMGTEV